MALKKVKLPNNTTVDVNDARVVSDAIVYKGEELGDATYTSGGAVVDLSDYQPLLVSGTNIKTINNESLLGSGNISISGGSGGGGEANVIEGVSFNGTTAPISNKIAAITYTPPVTSVNGATGAVTVSVPTKVSDLTNDSGFTSNTGTLMGITMNGSSKGTSGVVNLGTVVTSETDPVFSASAAAGITSSNISAWNAKQNAITISSSEPTSSDGSNGDIWIVV